MNSRVRSAEQRNTKNACPHAQGRRCARYAYPPQHTARVLLQHKGESASGTCAKPSPHDFVRGGYKQSDFHCYSSSSGGNRRSTAPTAVAFQQTASQLWQRQPKIAALLCRASCQGVPTLLSGVASGLASREIRSSCPVRDRICDPW